MWTSFLKSFLETNTRPASSRGVNGEGVGNFNFIDSNGLPAGGHSYGEGFSICWQNGPEKIAGRNGAQVDDILESVQRRIEFLNTADEGRYACPENELAILQIVQAREALKQRTLRRLSQGVEGTYSGK